MELVDNKKIIVWGYGQRGRELTYILESNPQYNCTIVGITDRVYKKVESYPFILCENLIEIDFQIIIIACDNQEYIHDIRTAIRDAGLDNDKEVYCWRDFLNNLRKEVLFDKYGKSEDKEIIRCMNWLRSNDLTVRNCWENTQHIKYDLLYDSSVRMPYVLYYGKRMYFPEEYWEKNITYIENVVERDQYNGSPHLYTTENHDVKKGDVIVDAGVCEGNFALKYVDIISKAYLIEPDHKWMKALKVTFAPWKDKVVFCEKMLGDTDGIKDTTLDELLRDEDKFDFLKMDIEGAEPQALLGGIDVLSRFKPKCSICSYHKSNDLRSIKLILESLGYQTSTSSGYMFFEWDKNIDAAMDFRRGVVYAD